MPTFVVGVVDFVSYGCFMANIAMVVSNHYDPDPRVHKEARTLVNAGHTVTVYAYDRQHKKPADSEVLDGVYICRIRTSKVPYGATLSTALGLAAFKRQVKARLFKSPPDVVHCHDQDTCSVGLWWKRVGYKYLSGRPGKFVFDAHDLYWTYLTQQHQSSRLKHAGANILRRLDRYFAKQADLLITTSQAIGPHPGFAEVYKQWGIDPTVVWNAPIKPHTIPPLPDKFTLGYVGTIRYMDMFVWLVQAIETIDPISRPDLLIAGHGVRQSEVSELLSAAGQRLGINVHIEGSFQLKDLSAIFGRTSLQYCVYPDTSENVRAQMSVKLLDSIAHERRVIGNSDCLMGDWITHNQWGWTIKGGDIAALGQAIIEAQDPSQNKSIQVPPYWAGQAQVLLDAYQRKIFSI